jgi:hypothetical protein
MRIAQIAPLAKSVPPRLYGGAERAHEFDVLHCHIEPPLHFPLFRALKMKTVADMPLLSISDSRRTPVPALNWLATVYHGLSPGVSCRRPR